MRTLRTWGRILLVTLLLCVLSPPANAERRTTRTRTTDVERTEVTDPSIDETTEEPQRAGTPELGVLIIIGAVGFLVFVAWVFSRVGEGNSRQSDTPMD